MKEHLLEINNELLCIGLKNYNKKLDKIKFLSRFQIKEQAKKEGVEHLFISPVSIGNTVQYYFFNSKNDLNEDDDDSLNLSKEIINYVKNNDIQDVLNGAMMLSVLLSNSFYIRCISSDYGNNKYWVTYLSESREIIIDAIANGDDELAEYINTYTVIADESLKIFTNNKDQENVMSLFNDLSSDFFEILDDNEFTKEEFLKAYKNKLKMISFTKTKKIDKRIVVGCSSGLAILMLYLIVYPDTYYDEIYSGEYSEISLKSRNAYDNWIKQSSKKKKSKLIQVDEFEAKEKALNQIENLFYSQFFSKKDILENMLNLNKKIPMYMKEYKLIKIGYSQNNFVLFFERLTDSDGDFMSLDHGIEKFSRENGLSIKPMSIEKNGDLRIYKVEFDDSELKNKFSELIETRSVNSKNNDDSSIKDKSKEIESLKKKISGIKSSALNLNYFERAFFFDINEHYKQIKTKDKQLSKLYDEVFKLLNLEKKHSDFNYNLVDGTISSYIVNSQKFNYFYKFKNPAIENSFPSLNDGEKLADSIKNKVFASSYSINISSKKEISSNPDDFIRGFNLVLADNIKINSVEIIPETWIWAIDASLFEAKK